MEAEREELYAELRAQVGNTPLIRIDEPDENGNIILAKLESEARWGGHYDRVYPELFYDFESKGRIRPGRNIILETSTGNAGISTAAIGTRLGYDTHLGVPASIDWARKDAIRDHGGIVYEIEGDYVNAFPDFAREFRQKYKGVVNLNHSMGLRGQNNEVTLKALESIADEAIAQVREVVPDHPRIDIYVAGVGNGSTVLGPGLRFIRHGADVYGTEPVSSAVLFELLHPGLYRRLYGIEQGSMPRHDVYGLSYPGLDFPHIRNSAKIVEDSVLVASQEDLRFLRAANEKAYDESRKNMVLSDNWGEYTRHQEAQIQLPRWESCQRYLDQVLEEQGYNPVGRSSAVGLAAALEISDRVHDSTILFLCYDQLIRYDAAQQRAA